MTAHDRAYLRPEQAPSHFIAAERLVRPTFWPASATALTAGSLLVLFVRVRPSWLAGFNPPGFVGLASGALFLSALGLFACLCVVLARRRNMTPVLTGMASRTSPRRIAGWPQTLVILPFAAAAIYAVLVDWPLPPSAAATLALSNGFTAASVLLLLATPWFLLERSMATITPDRLPEIDDLRALLFLPVFFLAAEAVLQIAGGLGFGSLQWARVGLAAVLLLICAELSLRVIGTWFLPPRDSIAARATIASFLAAMLSGRALSPAGVVRSQFGMDFSRSWALHFTRVAAFPIVLVMLVFCWFLTSVTRIDLNERGCYERFGVAAAVLRPGLHLVLPWPFGIVRHQELGVVHVALISHGDRGAAPPDQSAAEGAAPVSANRLWDSEQSSDVSYIIASGDQDRQSFQTVSVSVSVLYRIGLSDAAARAALYNQADPDALIHALTGRLLAQYLAAETLPSVLGENQGVIAGEVRRRLQVALDTLGNGIDILTVTVEAIHPPSGAASSYRNVQAAEIAATTAIATERGRARTTASVAQQNAYSTTNDASASAGEAVSAARADLTNVTADDRPFRAASRPFLLERYFTDVKATLENIPLEIIDHRLKGSSLPTIDLRPPGTVSDGLDARPQQAEKTP